MMHANDQQHPENNVQSTTHVAPSTVTLVSVPTLLSLTTLTLSFWNDVLPFSVKEEEPDYGGGRGWRSPA